MAIRNERLHSLSSAKDNSLRITFHDSMITLSSSFYSSVPVVFRSESNISLGEVQDLTTSALSLCVCICVNQTNRNSMMTLSTLFPLLEMLYLLQLMRGKYCHMVFSSLTRLSSHVTHADMASSVGCLTHERMANSFWYYVLLHNNTSLHQHFLSLRSRWAPQLLSSLHCQLSDLTHAIFA